MRHVLVRFLFIEKRQEKTIKIEEKCRKDKKHVDDYHMVC